MHSSHASPRCSQTLGAKGVSVVRFTGPCCGLLLLLSACHSAAEGTADVLAYCSFAPEPVIVGDTDVLCRLTTPAGEPVAAERVHLEANMTHPGMRPVHATMTEVSPGVFGAQFSFTMAGDWYVLVSGDLPDGVRFEETVAVDGVRAGE